MECICGKEVGRLRPYPEEQIYCSIECADKAEVMLKEACDAGKCNSMWIEHAPGCELREANAE